MNTAVIKSAVTMTEAQELADYLHERKAMTELPSAVLESQPPIDLLKAISKASKQIGSLTKDNHNKFGKFKYASIDDFLLAVNPVLADNNLVIWTNELSCRLPDETFDRFVFQHQFTVFHTGSGESLTSTVRTTVINNMGSQSSGAGQSYALKQFLRGLFLIATGDKDDPDAHPSLPTPIPKKSAGKGRYQGKASKKQLDFMYSLADENPNFDHQWIFRHWVLAVKGKLPDDMDKDEASAVIEWLQSEKAEWKNWLPAAKEKLHDVNKEFVHQPEYAVMMGDALDGQLDEAIGKDGDPDGTSGTSGTSGGRSETDSPDPSQDSTDEGPSG